MQSLEPAVLPQSAVGVFQNAILSKLSDPLSLQPVGPSSALPVQADSTTGTEPNHAARSPCSFTSSECSIHLYAQLGCGASMCIMVVSAHPVAPSAGMVLAMCCMAAFRVFTWYGHDPEAAVV